MAFNKEKEAKRVYKLVQEVCDGYKLKYKTNDEELSVEFYIAGDKMEVKHLVCVHKDLCLVYVLSDLPFKADEGCTNEVAQAANLINSRLMAGSMDYSPKSLRLCYRLTTSYEGMDIQKEAIAPLLLYTYSVVNKYNYPLQKVATGAA
ncbi:MAG: hypothetical protein IKC47_00260, partial [Clostridia bacterium]|nr:hypothetical protein [Clostridia bacterium]